METLFSLSCLGHCGVYTCIDPSHVGTWSIKGFVILSLNGDVCTLLVLTTLDESVCRL